MKDLAWGITFTILGIAFYSVSGLTWPGAWPDLTPLVPATVGAAAVLLVAFKAYPVQKNKDRELKIDEEKRQAFRNYLRSVEAMSSQANLEKSTDGGAALEAKIMLNEVALLASNETFAAMQALYERAGKLTNYLESGAELNSPQGKNLLIKTGFAFDKAVNSARKELGLEHLSEHVSFVVLEPTDTQGATK